MQMELYGNADCAGQFSVAYLGKTDPQDHKGPQDQRGYLVLQVCQELRGMLGSKEMLVPLDFLDQKEREENVFQANPCQPEPSLDLLVNLGGKGQLDLRENQDLREGQDFLAVPGSLEDPAKEHWVKIKDLNSVQVEGR
ncbi:UNVERIFIED_CONTAM: hypothetical protein K2H54_021829 [Gekko kuhli]